MFAGIRLGSHKEPMRQMILTGDPGPQERYHFVAQVLVNDGPVVDGVVMEPTTFKRKGRHVHLLLFGGCAWNYVISRHPLQEFLPLALTTSGTLPLLRQQITRLDLFADFLVDYLRSQVEREGSRDGTT
jgi:hypothetical protein